MNINFIKTLSFILLGAFFVCSQVFADGNIEKKVIYKYKYNNVPMKQPVITQSMKPAVEEYNNGDYLGAMVDLKKVVEEEENNIYAKYYLALCYTRLGYKTEANELYEQIISKDSSYPLTYYSKRAMNCMEEHSSDNPICGPVKKYKAPDLTNYVVKSEEEPGVGETPNENNENKPKEDDDIAKFIKSGKKIHPAAMDRISRERAERKIQADMYSRQQAEQEALNQSN